MVVLSERLQCLADMVSKGNTVADVGCDHGFLSIYLVQNKISERVLAMDVRKGPLSQAQAHIKENHLSDYIETRLSDGLEAMQVGEADTCVCAGMGGPLMMKILSDYKEKTDSFKELILQPQSEIAKFRAFLRSEGYVITEEKILLEDGKYYFPMKVVKADCDTKIRASENKDNQQLFDLYGEHLITEKNELLIKYLREKKELLKDIVLNLQNVRNERAMARYEEVVKELECIEKTLVLMEA